MLKRLLLTSLIVPGVSMSEADAQEAAPSEARSEIVRVTLADGETMTGKLYLPAGDVRTLVMFVHGTGPGTYLNRRKLGTVEFNYFDMFGEQFNKRGAAFFSYNKRGVELSDKPPMYDKVDREKFRKVVPHIEAADLGAAIKHLRKDRRLGGARVVLFGWSEGTLIASMVAEDQSNNVGALFLAGYAHENMYDIIKWQFSGASSMRNLNPAFDKNEDGTITRKEYESDEKQTAAYRKAVMQDTKFEVLDRNKDGVLTAADFAMAVASHYETLLQKTQTGDADWIWKNYFRISPAWLREHFALEPNKTRLLRIDIPVYVFHGTDDANVDVAGVLDLKKRFDVLGKKNLHTFVFDKHNHDLNFQRWAIAKKIPAGIEKIFETVDGLSRQQ